MAVDQRYCLECGERRSAPSEFLAAGPPKAASAPPLPPGTALASAADGASAGAGRGGTLSVIAGVGVLLLAMGVGVLIGRAGSGRSAPAQVITVGAAPNGTTGTAGAEEAFSEDWPAGTNGFTVQLETLPQTGTTLAAIDQAKSAASAKGARAVGALKTEDFSSLPAGSYAIYSGVYHKRTEAQRALTGLKGKFSGAKVIAVSEGAAGGSSTGTGKTGASGGSGGSTPKHPAPPSVLEGLSHAKGKSYVEKSKNLPNVVSTG
jgi:hypothetical protein